MKNKMKVFIAMLILVSLVACQTPKEKDDTASDGSLSGEITFWHSFTQGKRLDVIQSAADEFMKENPDVSITIETFPWGDFYTKWTTGLASNNVPDMSTALPGHVVEMIDADALIPINDVIDKVGREEFSKAALSEGTVDGENYSIPLYSHAQVMWYRMDILEEHGLEVPQTWEELKEAAMKVSNDEVYGLSFPTGSQGANDLMAARFLNYYVRSGGGSLLTEDLKANLTSDLALEGIRYWVDIYNEVSPKDSINYDVLDQATLFYQGKTAFDFNTGFHVGGVEANSPDLIDKIAAAPIPKHSIDDETQGIETGNIPLVVWKNSKHPEIAKAFIEYLYQDDLYIEFLEATPVGMLPSKASVYENEKYWENETVQDFEESVNVIRTAVEKGTAIGFERGPSVQAGYLVSQGIIEEMFQEIIVNDKEIEEAAQEAEDQLNTLFSAALD